MKHSPRFRVTPRETPLPQTREEWQDAADCADWALALDSARQYGLVTGGPRVYVERCEGILKLAAERGIRPHPDAIERVMGAKP